MARKVGDLHTACPFLLSEARCRIYEIYFVTPYRRVGYVIMMLVSLLFQIHYECYAFAREYTLAALLVQRCDTLHCSMELITENVL